LRRDRIGMDLRSLRTKGPARLLLRLSRPVAALPPCRLGRSEPLSVRRRPRPQLVLDGAADHHAHGEYLRPQFGRRAVGLDLPRASSGRRAGGEHRRLHPRRDQQLLLGVHLGGAARLRRGGADARDQGGTGHARGDRCGGTAGRALTALAGALFDLDGTLVDTFAICYLAFRRAVERSGGRAPDDAEVHALFGPSEDGMMQRVLPARWEDALALYFEEYDRLRPTCAPLIDGGVGSALELLRRRKIPVGLVTGKTRVTAETSLRHFGLDHIFEAVETGSPGGVVKADDIRRVVARWGVDAADVIYVGDAQVDMLAAHDAGAISGGAGWAAAAPIARFE